MQLVPHPIHLPGVCIACQGGTSRQCVDTMAKVGNWRVYVCKQCALEIAALFGFHPQSSIDVLMTEVEELRGLVQHLDGQLTEAKGSQVRVVPVEEIVPYVKKREGRPRIEDGSPQEAEAKAPAAA